MQTKLQKILDDKAKALEKEKAEINKRAKELKLKEENFERKKRAAEIV